MRIKNGHLQLMKKIILSSLLLIWLFLSMGCATAKHTRAIQSLETLIAHTEIGEPPVWRGIVPGKSTEREVRQIMETANPKAFSFSVPSGAKLPAEGSGYVWEDKEHSLSASLAINEGVVSYLEFKPPKWGLTVNEILNAAGEPTSYYAYPLADRFVVITFLYESTGVAIESYIEVDPYQNEEVVQLCQYRLEATAVTEGVSVFFIDPGSPQDMVASFEEEIQSSGEIAETWSGLGMINLTWWWCNSDE